MRAILKIELIGDDTRWGVHHIYSQVIKQVGRTVANALFGSERPPYPWVAKITGTDKRYGFARVFMQGNRDYSRANSIGSRGVYVYYPLEPGIYEVNQQLTWHRWQRYFLVVDKDANKQKVTKDVVINLLNT